MHQQSTTTQRGNDDNQTVRSWWSEEDDAFLAEVEGVPGTLIHGDTEEEARAAAIDDAEEWRVVLQQLARMSADDFIRWMNLDRSTSDLIRSLPADGLRHRSLKEWNQLLCDLDRK